MSSSFTFKIKKMGFRTINTSMLPVLRTKIFNKMIIYQTYFFSPYDICYILRINWGY